MDQHTFEMTMYHMHSCFTVLRDFNLLKYAPCRTLDVERWNSCRVWKLVIYVQNVGASTTCVNMVIKIEWLNKTKVPVISITLCQRWSRSVVILLEVFQVAGKLLVFGLELLSSFVPFINSLEVLKGPHMHSYWLTNFCNNTCFLYFILSVQCIIPILLCSIDQWFDVTI